MQASAGGGRYEVHGQGVVSPGRSGREVRSDRRDATALDAPCRCPKCGTEIDPFEIGSTKRGAVVVTGRPRRITWRGRIVGLSPTQAEIFAVIANRGRASFEAIDEAMLAFGASPQTRSIHILRIRRKFQALGAQDPFERVGNAGFRLVVEPDEEHSTATIIGLRGG